MPISHKLTLARRNAATLQQTFIAALVAALFILLANNILRNHRTVRVFIIAATGSQYRMKDHDTNQSVQVHKEKALWRD